jgi:hypothetical protein
MQKKPGPVMGSVIGCVRVTVFVPVLEYVGSPALRVATQVMVKPELPEGVTVMVEVPFPDVIVPPEVIVHVNKSASHALAVKVTGVMQHS